MNKTLKFYGIIFLFVMFLLALMQLGKKDVTDWRKNFDINEKTPFGLYIFSQEANALLNKKIERSELSPFSYYGKNPKKAPHNILVIEKNLDYSSWKKILEQVNSGSDVMVFSTNAPPKLEDTLGFRMGYISEGEKEIYQLTETRYENDTLIMDKFPENLGFSYIKKDHEILGNSYDEEDGLQANFIKINFGKGHVYYHADPTVITNYYLLKPNADKYVQGLFSYLPNRETLWFVDTQSSGSKYVFNFIFFTIDLSALAFILSNPALKYSWWLLLAGLLLFAIFHAKRKQRTVPIIEPLKNKSVEFVRSIGNLYLQEGDFHDMMAKKAQYFLNKVRLDLMIDTQNLDENFAKKLHLKTGKSLEKINEAIALIKKAQDPYASVMKEDLIKMNKLLDEILK